MLGRVIDPLGEPLDGKGLIGGELYDMPLERKSSGSNLSSACEPAVADRIEGCGRHDSYRSRTA